MSAPSGLDESNQKTGYKNNQKPELTLQVVCTVLLAVA
jgi:hypothetical protein